MDPRLERAIRYVEGEMDTAEREAIEAAMRADPHVREDVESARRTIAGLRYLGEERLRSELREEEQRSARKEKGGAGNGLFRWAAAAMLLIASGSAWWYFTRDTPERLADEFAITEPGLPVLMSVDARATDAIMNAYKQGDDATAKELLITTMEMSPGNDTLTYFLGIVDAHMGRCDLAQESFAELGATSTFLTRGRYHAAICALRNGDAGRAESLLSAVASSSDAQLAPKARDLLARLKRP
ncbi:MAG: hypothetical protein IPP83_00305 [Flavobacteriales bacterium]|nr:hypothetical protein [Flavobacteriales bacterium]